MSNFILVARNVTPIKKMAGDDRSVVGTYHIEFEDSECTQAEAAEALMDSFHDHYGIENLDDFDIRVFTASGQEIEREEVDAPDDETADDPVFISSSTVWPTPPASPPAKTAKRRVAR